MQNKDEFNNSSNFHNSIFSDLGKGQKIAVIFLAFFSVFLIIFWVNDFVKSINAPLEIPRSSQGDEPLAGSEANNADKDTDDDGLPDSAELNIYNTSPYLEDTDSDGFSDKEEIDSGNDPNCPTGEDCTGSEFSGGDILEQQSGDDLENIQKQLDLNLQKQRELTAQEKEVLGDNLGGYSPDELRKLLIDAGMDQSILDQISDEDLMNNYKNILSQ